MPVNEQFLDRIRRVSPNEPTCKATAMACRGVVFIDQSGDSAGVHLRKRGKEKHKQSPQQRPKNVVAGIGLLYSLHGLDEAISRLQHHKAELVWLR